jgi:hypothetical protein
MLQYKHKWVSAAELDYIKLKMDVCLLENDYLRSMIDKLSHKSEITSEQPYYLTAHELARRLLAGPDYEVQTPDIYYDAKFKEYYPCVITDVIYNTDSSIVMLETKDITMQGSSANCVVGVKGKYNGK